MKKVLIVFGTRPEAIKMYPVIMEMRKREGIKTAVCVTWQHREMLRSVLDELCIIPDFELDVMREDGGLSSLCSVLLERIDKVLESYLPDLVLVHGDTSSAFAAALAAFYRRIPCAHVEAGLRTDSVATPFPEEAHRRAISLISDIDFAPTKEAAQRLCKEGKRSESIYVTGNTAIDALRYTVKKDYVHPLFEWVGGNRLMLLTAHRRENIGEPMERIFRGIRRACEENEDVCVIYPMHKNPAVREIATRCIGGCERIMLTEPLSVVEMHNIMARAYAVVTDSGGLQEEAPHLNVPVLVIRESTERCEGVAAGAIRLIGTDEASVYEGITRLLCDRSAHLEMSRAASPYGSGNASRRIADVITTVLNGDCLW